MNCSLCFIRQRKRLEGECWKPHLIVAIIGLLISLVCDRHVLVLIHLLTWRVIASSVLLMIALLWTANLFVGLSLSLSLCLPPPRFTQNGGRVNNDRTLIQSWSSGINRSIFIELSWLLSFYLLLLRLLIESLFIDLLGWSIKEVVGCH